MISESDSDIQFFLDFAFECQQKRKHSVSDFLEIWELKKDKLSIVAPEAENAVRIMTIHKAKGLEFPVVIFPYDIDIYNQIKPKVWFNQNEESLINSFLVNYSNKLNYVGNEGVRLFNKRREELELDNFNILYVALTRAVEQLYIVSEKKASSKNNGDVKYVSELFINYLEEKGLWNSELQDYYFGNPNRLKKVIKEKGNTIIQKGFISNSWKNHNISIVANSSLLWGTEQGKAIGYGNLIHEILSFIKTSSDIKPTVNEYLYKGVITKKEKSALILILNKIVNHPALTIYFNQNSIIYTEQEIITSDKSIIIPDRLVIRGELVSIIDYKTGNPKKEHHHQLNNYAHVLEELNFSVEKKMLVYINEEITIEEV